MTRLSQRSSYAVPAAFAASGRSDVFVMPGQNLGGVCNCLSYVLGKRLADESFEFPSGPITRVSTVEEESIQNDGSMFAAMMGVKKY